MNLNLNHINMNYPISDYEKSRLGNVLYKCWKKLHWIQTENPLRGFRLSLALTPALLRAYGLSNIHSNWKYVKWTWNFLVNYYTNGYNNIVLFESTWDLQVCWPAYFTQCS
jgi:hypothetical protein